MTMQDPIRGDKRYLTAYINREVIAQVDDYRRNTPRSQIVQKALIQFLEREVPTKQASGERDNKKE
jgi:hypothetical protein